MARAITNRPTERRSLVVGMSLLAVSFPPLAVVPGSQRFGAAAAISALLVAAALLAVGTAAVFPFEMDTVVSLANGRLVATHYGFYNTVVGVGILIGNLATGAVVGAAHDAGADWAVWVGLIAIGALAALALHGVNRSEPAEARASVAADPHATTSSERHDHALGRTVPPVSPPTGRRDDRITNDVEVC
ncbi:MFS transporter [Nocardia amamiensis]